MRQAAVELASGQTPTAGSALTRLDPGELANGFYVLRLSARDIAGRGAQTRVQVEVNTALKPGGCLLLEVPNLIEHESLELSHLYAFTRSTLREIVRQAGFRVLWTKTHGSFRSPILNLYITILAQAKSEPQLPRKIRSNPFGIKTGRRLGKLKRELLTSRFPDWTWQAPD